MSPQAAENVRLAEQARRMRLNPTPNYGPQRLVWALEGYEGLSSCCMAGNVGCCDLAQKFSDNGQSMGCYDDPMVQYAGGSLEGLGDFSADLLEAVKGALSVIPGASYAGLTPEKVQLVYEVLTGEAASELKGRVKKYNERAGELNSALKKINRMTDAATRESLRKEHAALVKEQAQYGAELIDQIERYNGLVDVVKKYSAGFAAPGKVDAYSLSQISLPTMSGMGSLGVAWFAIAIPAAAVCIAAMFYYADSMTTTYCNYQLRLRGIDPGLDARYSGFMGKINRVTDTIGDLMKGGMLLGVVAAGVLGWMYWKKKWIFAPKTRTALKALPAKVVEGEIIEELPVAANPRRRRGR